MLNTKINAKLVFSFKLAPFSEHESDQIGACENIKLAWLIIVQDLAALELIFSSNT